MVAAVDGGPVVGGNGEVELNGVGLGAGEVGFQDVGIKDGVFRCPGVEVADVVGHQGCAVHRGDALGFAVPVLVQAEGAGQGTVFKAKLQCF